MDDPQGPAARPKGRGIFQEPNWQGHHLAAKHQDWANQMVGDALYQQTLMILRNLRNGPNGRKANSRKWAESECGIQIGENGEDWKTISVILWWMRLEDACLKHVLVRPYEIFEISMGHNREEEWNPRRNLRIGTTGTACNVAAINVMVETIEGVVGAQSLVEANEALAAIGHLSEMHVPEYGYARGILLLRERMDFDLCNDWARGDLDALTYEDRQWGTDH